MGKSRRPSYGEVVDATAALRNSAYGRYVLNLIDLIWTAVEETDIQRMLRCLVRQGRLEQRGTGEAARYVVPRRIGPAAVVGLKLENSAAPWDGRWRVFTYDMPVDHNTGRHRLVRRLHEIGCARLGRSAWVSPYDWRAVLGDTVRPDSGRFYCVECHAVCRLGEDTAADMLGLWELSDVRRRYERIVRRCSTAPRGKAPSARRARARALLAAEKERVRLEYDDPMLPKEVLPRDWPRDEALSALRMLRGAVQQDLEVAHPSG